MTLGAVKVLTISSPFNLTFYIIDISYNNYQFHSQFSNLSMIEENAILAVRSVVHSSDKESSHPP